jgi:hypothetical protein
MRLIGEAVLESAGAAFEYVYDAPCYEDSAQRRVTAGDSLPDQDDVWLNVPMLNGEWLAGAAHAAHDFVGDEKNPAIAADFGDALGVAIGRYGGTESGAYDRFEDERGDACGVVLLRNMVEIIRANNSALGIFLVEGAVIAEAGRDVSPFGKERLIRGAASDVAADGHGTERTAVVTLAARDDAIARGLTALKVELSCKLDGCFRGFRTAGREIDASAGAKVWRGESEEAAR